MGRTQKPVEAEAAPAVEIAEEGTEIVVDKELLDENPVLAEAGVKVGDVGVVVDESEIGAPVDEAEEEPEVDGDSVTVAWNGGERTYSLVEHGKDFKKLAKQFAEKFGGTIA